MSDETDGQHGKRLAMYVGTVTRNDDPEKLGRVRLRIPGVIEPESGWALPMGMPGGGTKRRGFYNPPDPGAEVCVFFNAGEVDAPYYLPGNWGRGETPGPVGGYGHPKTDGSPGDPEDIDPRDAAKVKSFETAKWILTFDDRDGKEKFYAENKRTGDHVLIDGSGGAVDIKATTLLNIHCDGIVNIDGTQVNIRQRPVMPNGKAIA